MTIPDDPLAPRRVAGYRVLRPLARDGDAEVLLGYQEGDPVAHQTVALKVSKFDGGAWNRAVAVLEALERARGPHVVEVLDLEADDDRLTMVFERLPRGSLADLLARRERLDPGEVVTVVAPVAAALLRMHAAGVAHGAVGSRTIMFRDDGAPVLMGFGHSRLFAAGAPEVVHEQHAGVVADRTAARELASQLLSRVTGSRSRAARDLVEQLQTCPDAEVLELLTIQLFSVAAALPVRFRRDDEPAVGSTRVVPVQSLGMAIADDQAGGARRDRISALGRVIPDAAAQRVLDAVDGSPVTTVLLPVVRAARRRWALWSPRRRRVAVAGLATMVVFAAALAVVPSAPPSSARAGPRGASARPDVRTSAGPTAPAVSDRDQVADDVLAADDPIAASIELLKVRERCLRSLSVACLEGAEQVASGALSDDRATIVGVQQGGELPDPLVHHVDALAPELVERLGDSALVRLATAASGVPTMSAAPQREPASLLLVKGEAGWRIRDVIAAQKGTG